jgi:glycosyltransferase involved in cell wall biosynthesis
VSAAPQVSLIMASWHSRPDWLLAAVRSALDQRGCDHELIVVDDGSSQPVTGVLEEVRDPRLGHLRVEHGGESRARNAGLLAARGRVIRFVDADDVIHPDSTARLLAIASGDQHTIAYGATMVCDAALRPLWKMTCKLEGDVLADCLLGRFTVRIPSVLFPRPVVDAVGGWDPGFRVSQDWDFVLRALEYAHARGSRDVAAYYRRHGDSATADVGAGEDGGRRVLERALERHPEWRGSTLARRAEAGLHARSARAYLSRRQLRPALLRAGRAVALDPKALVDEARRSVPGAVGLLRPMLSK